MKTLSHDDGLEWLREIRRNMAAKFDHDPKQAAAYHQKMQRRCADRLFRREEPLTTQQRLVATPCPSAEAPGACERRGSQ